MSEHDDKGGNDDRDRSEIIQEKDIGGISSSLEFYSLIKEASMVKNTPEAKAQYHRHKRIFEKLQPLVCVVYIAVLPLLEAPEWCADYWQTRGLSRTDFFLECKHLGVPYSGLPTMGPFFTTFVDIICVSYLAFIKLHKSWFKEPGKHDRRRNIFFIIIYTASLIDYIVSIVNLEEPYLAAFLRPFILAMCMKSIRKNFMHHVQDIRDSMTILLAIFIFVFVYAILGNYLFERSIEGYMYFSTLADSYYNMLILLTTANFPDVMLPAYNESFYWCLYFVSFLVLGLYALLNLLLAQVYSSFRNRLV